MGTFTVGQVAERSGLTPRAVRLYERRGLIPETTRTNSGYRTYGDGDVDVLRFIHQARDLGLSLEEIKRILDLQQAGITPCATVLDLVDAHIREIDDKVRSLGELRSTLVRARRMAQDSNGRGKNALVCRIVEASR